MKSKVLSTAVALFGLASVGPAHPLFAQQDPARNVVSRLCEMDSDGARLTRAGWHKVAAIPPAGTAARASAD